MLSRALLDLAFQALGTSSDSVTWKQDAKKRFELRW